MNDINEHYNQDWFAKRLFISWRAVPVCRALDNVFHPSSVVDVGCAIGDLVKGFIDMGIGCMGIDAAPGLLPFYMADRDVTLFMHDMRKALPMGVERYDLCTCFDVYSVIDEHHRKRFLRNLTKLSGRVLVGVPFDDAHMRAEVADTMSMYRFRRDMSYEAALKEELEPIKNKQAIKGIYYNTLYFRKINDAHRNGKDF